jgi:hypothetical protein
MPLQKKTRAKICLQKIFTLDKDKEKISLKFKVSKKTGFWPLMVKNGGRYGRQFISAKFFCWGLF